MQGTDRRRQDLDGRARGAADGMAVGTASTATLPLERAAAGDGASVRPSSKIRAFDDLVAALEPLRGIKRIVHCHGVFDLLHIGHIRHFQQAKALGDILVVTVTPDRHVNKGPGRPVFPQDLRVEAIAGLACVDFVAINLWPTAKETIGRLRPDIFAKGSEFRDAAKDRTGAITVEEAAVRAAGGRLVLTDDLVQFSSSNLLNRHLPTLPREVMEYLERLAARHPAGEILGWLERCRPLKVLVVGETIIDEYQYCDTLGKSSKEPMLAVRLRSMERFAGGILAVANHVASVCDRVGVLTFLGTRNSQEEFLRSRLSERVEPTFLYRQDAPTIVKRRLIDDYFFQKMMEIYEIDEVHPPAEGSRLCEALEAALPGHDAVLVVDYGHGMLGEDAVRLLCDKAPFLAVSAQANAGNFGYHTISKYHRADYASIAEMEIRLETRTRKGEPEEMVLQVARRLDCPKVVLTRGASGCLAWSRDEGFCKVPAFATRVVDRMGAGDSFTSVTAPCAAIDAPMEVLAFVGSAAGAQAVASVGNRTPIERVPLIRHIECLLK